jgi:hypothetical protein
MGGETADSGAIAMGDETTAAQDDHHQFRSGATGVWCFRLVFFFAKVTARQTPTRP